MTLGGRGAVSEGVSGAVAIGAEATGAEAAGAGAAATGAAATGAATSGRRGGSAVIAARPLCAAGG